MTAEEAAATSGSGQARILLADDDARLLKSLQALLGLYNYNVDTALGGASAIEKLTGNQYDLLLLDLKMPEVSGHDVMAWMSTHNIDTMTIVVSGETSLDDISRALRHGAYDYLKKPYVPDELAATVNNAVRKKLLENANRLMQEKLNRSERLHRFIVNTSPDVIFILDHQGRFSFINSRIESLLGFTRNQLLGQHLNDIVHVDDVQKVTTYLNRALASSVGAHPIEVGLKTHGDSRDKRHFELSLWHTDEKEDKSTRTRYRYFGTARDITERLEAEAFINFQAYHDLLTRLPNRALFKDRLSVAINQAERNGSQLAVMFIDLDRFKIINDSLGHTMGDRLLQAVAERLQKCIRKGDTLSRFGGDEFTLLLPELNSADGAIQVAEKIIASVKMPFNLSNHDIYVGASIGIALYPGGGDSMDTLIKNADIAMYRVKNTGKDGYQVYSSELHAISPQRLMLEQDIRRALENDEFEICFQPQVDTRLRRIVGVEALVRWNHPKLGRLGPMEFIPIAEESGLINDIDKQTLRSACRSVRRQQKTLPDLRLSVNLSPRMIVKDNFVETILAILDEEKFPPSLLDLEITENLLLNDSSELVDKLLRLSEHGIRLALDDFGTGYSSLSYLQKFPIHTLKIDRSFIHNIGIQGDNCIVDAIVAMAKGLKMNIIAEGVENRQQLAYLQALDCHLVQGYLFGQATSIDRITEHMQSELALLELPERA